LDILWQTVTEDLPKLKQQIDQLLSQQPPPDQYHGHIPGYDPPQKTESTPPPETEREPDDEPDLD
jgi:hypothetical protein